MEKKPFFKVGQVWRRKYQWPGEPEHIWFYKITSVPKMYRGEGAYAKIIKLLEDGKPVNKYIGEKQFLWDITGKIGNINPEKGWGRMVLVKGRR